MPKDELTKGRPVMNRLVWIPLLACCTNISAAAEVKVSIRVPQLLSASMSQLPKGPSPNRPDDNCHDRMIEPTTKVGLYVAQRGWGVTSEWEVGDLELVSFAGEFIGGTSGSCAIQQGNIGVFRNGQMTNLLYTASKSDEVIGQLIPLQNGAVRLWSGEYLRSPVADFTASGDTLNVRELPKQEAFCEGTATVPNLYGDRITDARTELKANGWDPVPQPPEGGGQQGDLHELGITETVGCSGTGFAYCTYKYRREGAELTVTTAGELYEQYVPGVTGYGVNCL